MMDKVKHWSEYRFAETFEDLRCLPIRVLDWACYNTETLKYDFKCNCMIFPDSSKQKRQWEGVKHWTEYRLLDGNQSMRLEAFLCKSLPSFYCQGPEYGNCIGCLFAVAEYLTEIMNDR